jgi:hypothetical protein
MEAVCEDSIWRQYVEAVCGGSMWRQYVEAVCGDSMWRQYVEAVCGDSMWRHASYEIGQELRSSELSAWRQTFGGVLGLWI